MASGDGTQPQLDDQAELDDEDLSPNIRRFIQIIADKDDGGDSTTEQRRALERERRVTRFSWTCEELNVAFSDISIDAETIDLLVDHGVRSTLLEIQEKTVALLRSIDGDPAS